jgi:uncharacterized membrane protein
MKNRKEKIVLGIIAGIVVFNLISLFISMFSETSYPEALRIVFGSFYVLFLPGFIISYLFFPKTKKFEEKSENSNSYDHISSNPDSIDIIERIALSFALSISIVPLVVFYFNLIGVKINLLNTFFTILAIILVSLFILYKKNKKA